MAARASIRWRHGDHYARWREDFDLLDDIGIHFLRYGPPIYRTFLAPGKYDWEFTDITFAELKRRDITPIVDLCHFGVPDWLGNFQNPDFASQFAVYAGAFADRYPWIQVYTPVNEMFICAIFSAKYGWWNEQMKTDRAFVTALKNIVKGNVLAMMEILKRRPDAIFCPVRILGIFPRRQPGRDRPRREDELAPIPLARSQLRAPRRQRDVRISDG
jgi:beta-glucosidase/6-phospho-beta-glucosidase/beta-galactosidase